MLQKLFAAFLLVFLIAQTKAENHDCFYKIRGHVLKGVQRFTLGSYQDSQSECLWKCLDLGRDECPALVIDRHTKQCKVYKTIRDSENAGLIRAKSHDYYEWKPTCVSERSRRKKRANTNTNTGSSSSSTQLKGYAAWAAWSACTKTCGNDGSRTRNRVCQNYGAQCDGPAQASDNCPSNPPCPSYQPWGGWSACSKTCGGGEKKRNRKCNTYGGCQGDAAETAPCNAQACCTNWAAWGQCSVTCGSGQKVRTRRCSIGGYGGLQYASKEEKETQDCQGQYPTCPEWTNWGSWGTCTKTCGGGTRVKTRTCSIPGKCPGQGQTSEACNSQECPKWEQWAKWSLCTVTCAGGTKTRARTCSPAGAACDGVDSETTDCNKLPCPEWSNWSPWGSCSASCAGGFRKRGRVCNQYNLCPGEKLEKQECNSHACPDFDHWGNWGSCSASCGGGSRERNRVCGMDDNYCLGDKIATDASCRCDGETRASEACNGHACAHWGEWQAWGSCSATCGGGGRKRNRKCINDPLFCAGANANDPSCMCPGEAEEPGDCNTMTCPNWGEWGTWGECSASCGGGARERKRPCVTDTGYCVGDKVGSDVCICTPGLDHSNEQCNAHQCPNWGSWTIWGACSAPCGGGKKSRTRVCNKDPTLCAGNSADASCSCPGDTNEETDCNTHTCSNWSDWASWGSCSKDCGGGSQSRTRPCSNDPTFCSSNANDPTCLCDGSKAEDQSCNDHICASWGTWGTWGTCSQNCGGGKQTRLRPCNNDITFCATSTDYTCQCPGNKEEEQGCNTQTCAEWSQWASWGACSVTCADGIENRKRECQTDTSFCSGANLQNSACICPGDGSEDKPCDKGECPQWSNWAPWSECTVLCGGGTRTRARKCPIPGGCSGLNEESAVCNLIECPEWGDWAPWSDCSVSCGGGSRVRTRTCAIEGACSPGENFENDPVPCNDHVCPSWSQWDQWTQCSVTCDKGQRIRNRKCQPSPGCLGRSEDLEPCLLVPCKVEVFWSAWAPCTKTCGGGEQFSSRRTCAEPTCPIERRTQNCHEQACPEWTQWDNWSTCSKTCGSGSRERKRTCPVVNGCVGKAVENDPSACNTQAC